MKDTPQSGLWGKLQGDQPWDCILATQRATDKRLVVAYRVDAGRGFVNQRHEDLVAGRQRTELLELFELLEWRRR